MSGDFVGLLQASVSTNTSTSTPITIPSTIVGLPEGQPLVIKIVSDSKAVFKVGKSTDSADKTVTSNFLSNGNIYAYANAIETYKATSISANSTPQAIHAIAVSAGGNFDVCFGYYI